MDWIWGGIEGGFVVVVAGEKLGKVGHGDLVAFRRGRARRCGKSVEIIVKIEFLVD